MSSRFYFSQSFSEFEYGTNLQIRIIVFYCVLMCHDFPLWLCLVLAMLNWIDNSTQKRWSCFGLVPS
jgi:hypothetical protein